MLKSKKIIPAILVKNFSEFKENIRIVEPYVDIVQIDAMDGEFVPNKTFFDPDIILGFSTSVEYEVHLMVKKEGLQIEKWAQVPVKRLIVHYEACKEDLREIIKRIKSFGIQVGVAINPKTPASEIYPYLESMDYLLVMSVTPGFSGQKFIPDVLEKVKDIRKASPLIKIGIDGGIDKSNLPLARDAGVDYFSAKSSIFAQEDIGKAVAELDSLAQG